jgi:hypothetical protein
MISIMRLEKIKSIMRLEKIESWIEFFGGIIGVERGDSI